MVKKMKLHFWKSLICISLLLLGRLSGQEMENYCESDCTESPFFLSARFLYWKATEDELEYVDKFHADASGSTILVNGEVQDLDFHWSPGTKLSIGYACDLCDLALTWTFLYSHPDASVSTPGIDAEFLKPNWFPFLLGGLADQASSDWRLHFNTLDLDLGKTFWIGKCAFLNPHVGIRAAWIDQRYQIRYHSAFQFTTGGVGETIFSNTSLDASNDFKAVGLRFGMDGQLFFCSNLSLIGGVSTSLLYGKFNVMEVINGGLILDVGGVPTFVPEILTLSETLYRPRFNIEGLLGLQWSTYLIPTKCGLSAALFYEAAVWINQNQIINRTISINDSPINATSTNSNINESLVHPKGNIQLTGFSFQVRLDKFF